MGYLILCWGGSLACCMNVEHIRFLAPKPLILSTVLTLISRATFQIVIWHQICSNFAVFT
uniref:Uncharacterized protein n=1 Tax=Octopus bimaculoides TaxID=37653 RepID=A0A0L8H689_OCTBM